MKSLKQAESQPGTQDTFFFVSFQLLMDVFLFLAFYDDEIIWMSEIVAGQDIVVVCHWHLRYILFYISHFFLSLFNH